MDALIGVGLIPHLGHAPACLAGRGVPQPNGERSDGTHDRHPITSHSDRGDYLYLAGFSHVKKVALLRAIVWTLPGSLAPIWMAFQHYISARCGRQGNLSPIFFQPEHSDSFDSAREMESLSVKQRLSVRMLVTKRDEIVDRDFLSLQKQGGFLLWS